MTFAVRKDDFIINMIVADYHQKAELETALDAELIDTAECNVTIGDYWNGEAWTRNIDGEQVVIDTTPKHEPTSDELLKILAGVSE